MANDKISNMTAAAVAALTGTGAAVEVSTGIGGVPATKQGLLRDLRTAMFAGGTGYTAADPLVCGTLNASGASTLTGGIYNASDMVYNVATDKTHQWCVNGGEKFRITADGFIKIANDGAFLSATNTYHEIATSLTGTTALTVANTASSGTYGLYVGFTNATPNNTYSYFLNCVDSTNQKAVIFSDGSFQSRTNSYGGISDRKLKQDIVDATSQWSDIKNLRVRKFRFKDNPNGTVQIGLVAQEVEQTSPGLVFTTPDQDNDNNPIGTFTKGVKYSVLYMKAIKALQEAMARIEMLEARLT